MKFTSKIIPLIIGGTVGSTVALNLLYTALDSPKAFAGIQLAQALSPEEVNLRAKQIIVRIDGAGTGSGSIVDYSDDVYTVLTNWHVIKSQGQYTVRTIDGRQHQVVPSSIKRLPGIDLGIVQFSSNQNYQIAELGNSNNLTEGQTIYFAGYPGELRREDNRYYRFFPANLVGILPKSTENGYSLVYNGEAFPGMSGGPVFNRDGLMIGIHGEANIHALSGATSNYGIPVSSYQDAIAKLNTPPEASQSQPVAATPEPAVPEAANPPASPPQTTEPEVTTPAPTTKTTNPVSSPPQPTEAEATTPEAQTEIAEPPAATQQPTEAVENNPQAEVAEQSNQNDTNPKTPQPLVPDNISSVPTFSANSRPTTATEKPGPEIIIKSEIVQEQEPEPEPSTTQSPNPPESTTTTEESASSKPSTTNDQQQPPEVVIAPEVVESAEGESPNNQRISLVSPKTGIDYRQLQDLLRDGKWSEADIHTYQLIEQIVKSAKRQNKHVFIELKTIAEFACSDLRTADYLWKKYSNDKFGFSPQQQIWQSVNQKGDFSTQTWRRFATEVGWKTGDVDSGSGYLLYEELDFEPSQAPAGHLPWWFSLSDEQQNVIKYLFARCNLNPTQSELEAETQQNNSGNTAQNKPGNQPNINKAPKSTTK